MRLVSFPGLVLVVAAAFGSGCGGGGESTVAAGGLPQGSEQSHVAPAEFTVAIDNPYWPARPGNRWIYREIEAGGTVKRDVVTVTGRTKMIADGVEARVVHDVATEHGRPAEVTDDWYAQDSAGNVWYLGEQTTEYENGRAVSSEGSWEAGVDGAQPGVIMPARPRTGQAYRQEFYAGEAEDGARVLSTEEQVQVPFGHFGSAVLTKETSPLEPRVVEYKLYAPNVGEAMAMDVSGESDREELISFTRR